MGIWSPQLLSNVLVKLPHGMMEPYHNKLLLPDCMYSKTRCSCTAVCIQSLTSSLLLGGVVIVCSYCVNACYPHIHMCLSIAGWQLISGRKSLLRSCVEKNCWVLLDSTVQDYVMENQWWFVNACFAHCCPPRSRYFRALSTHSLEITVQVIYYCRTTEGYCCAAKTASVL